MESLLGKSSINPGSVCLISHELRFWLTTEQSIAGTSPTTSGDLNKAVIHSTRGQETWALACHHLAENAARPISDGTSLRDKKNKGHPYFHGIFHQKLEIRISWILSPSNPTNSPWNYPENPSKAPFASFGHAISGAIFDPYLAIVLR